MKNARPAELGKQLGEKHKMESKTSRAAKKNYKKVDETDGRKTQERQEKK
jgi:hypothetical protein